MVVGADVTHPQKGSGCPSMAAIVATNDETSAQYLASGRLQKGKQEVSTEISASYLKANLDSVYPRLERYDAREGSCMVRSQQVQNLGGKIAKEYPLLP